VCVMPDASSFSDGRAGLNDRSFVHEHVATIPVGIRERSAKSTSVYGPQKALHTVLPGVVVDASRLPAHDGVTGRTRRDSE
jgi:hypothetical protein